MFAIDNLKTEIFNMDLFKTEYFGLNSGFGFMLLYYAVLLSQIFMIFMLGACLCGLFQCLIYRIDKKINPFIPRSFCEFCGETLKFIDAVPFLNYLVLRGKSRCCKKRLPEKYFISEIISGIIMLFLVLSPAAILVAIPSAIIIIYIIAYFFYTSIKRNSS
jgi:prepilin signal peptidase PulO-like enzyme (type II secretory pathway)